MPPNSGRLQCQEGLPDRHLGALNYFLNRSGCEFRFAFEAFVRAKKTLQKSPHAPTPLLSCPVSCPDRTIKAVQRQCGWSLTQIKPAGIAAHATSSATLSNKQVQNPSMLHCQMSNKHVATFLAVTFALPCSCRSSRPSQPSLPVSQRLHEFGESTRWLCPGSTPEILMKTGKNNKEISYSKNVCRTTRHR